MSLADQPCVACRPGSSPVSPLELADFLTHYSNWSAVERDGILKLECRFVFKDYARALAFTNRVAENAQVEDHHPGLLLEWGQVTVTWWTHAIRGLHHNDLIMAARTNNIYSEF